MAEEGHTPSIALLMEVASALDNPAYPDRQDDAKLAQLLLAGVSKTKRSAATKDIAAWLEAEAAQQDGSRCQLLKRSNPPTAPSLGRPSKGRRRRAHCHREADEGRRAHRQRHRQVG